MAAKVTTKSNSNNVQLSTYMSWKLDDSFDVDVVDVDSRRTVNKIYCKSCRKHADKIRLDCRLKGQAKNDCLTYAEGSSNVVKSAVTRHLTSVAHAIALEIEQETVKTEDSSNTTNVSSGTGVQSNRGAKSDKRIKKLEYEVEELKAALEGSTQEIIRVNKLLLEGGTIDAKVEELLKENERLLDEKHKAEKLYSSTLALLELSVATCKTLSETNACLQSDIKELEAKRSRMDTSSFDKDFTRP